MLLTSIAFTSGDYVSLADQPVEIEIRKEALEIISQALELSPSLKRIKATVSRNRCLRLHNQLRS